MLNGDKLPKLPKRSFDDDGACGNPPPAGSCTLVGVMGVGVARFSFNTAFFFPFLSTDGSDIYFFLSKKVNSKLRKFESTVNRKENFQN
jgi:hypothetical protein